ncbi:hypothetical protein WT24_07095 [Burkholderia sp. MSMB1078WGS]|nr:hypothetical protein WT24_07095 [Burkholderia sp. MSMB1078WGS]
MFGPVLWGVATAGLVGAGVSALLGDDDEVPLVGGGSNTDDKESSSAEPDTTAPSKPTIDGITDNTGDELLPVGPGGTTNDATPVINGTGEPESTVEVIIDGEPVGTTVVNEDGTWTFEPDTPLADGEHQIEVVAQDDAGNRSEPSEPVVVVVDTTAPSKPTIDGITDNTGDELLPVGPGGTTNDATPVLDGKGEPGATIEVIVDGEPVGTTVVNEDGTWTFEPETPLADGEHQIEVVAQDDAGNRSEPSDPVVVVVDTTAPSKPTIDHITDNTGDELLPVGPGGTTNDATPVINGTGEPESTVEVIIDGEPVGTTVVNEDGTWTFEPDTPLAEGEHQIEVVVEDDAGNRSEPSDPVVVVVDTTAPSKPTIDHITDNAGDTLVPIASGGTTNDATPVLDGKGEPGATIEVIVDGEPVGTTVVNEDGTWTFEPETPLADGEHQIEVVAQDDAGNRSEPSEPVVVVVDTTAPSKPTIDGITDNTGDELLPVGPGGTTNDATPVINGTGEPESTVEVIIDGEPVGTTVVNEDGTWTFEPDTPLADGEHQIEVVAQDDAGNRSEPSDPVVVIVDTAPPVAPVAPTIDHITDNAGDTLVPIASGGTTSDATPVLDGKGEPGATIEVIVDGEPVGTTVVDEDGTWTFEPDTPLADGEHQIEVVAQDDAGNRSEPSEPVDVVVNTVVPTATAPITAIGKDSGFSDLDFLTNDGSSGRLMQGTVNGELADGEKIQITTDGGITWVDAIVRANGSWIAIDQNEHVESWVIQTRVVSAAGIQGAVTTTEVALDTVAPDAPSSLSINLGTYTVTVGINSSGANVGDIVKVDWENRSVEYILTNTDIQAGYVEVTIPDTLTATLSEASIIKAAIVDAAGNTSDYAYVKAGVGGWNGIVDFEDVEQGTLLSATAVDTKGVIVTEVDAGYNAGGLKFYTLTGNGFMSDVRAGNSSNALAIFGTVKIALENDISANSVGMTLGNVQSDVIFKFFDSNGNLIYSEIVAHPPSADESLLVDVSGFDHAFVMPDGLVFSYFTVTVGQFTPSVPDIISIDDLVFDGGSVSSSVVTGTETPAETQIVSLDSSSYYGDSSDNVFLVSDVSVFDRVTQIAGNGGIDAIRLTGENQIFDVTKLNGGVMEKVTGIEVFDITGSGDNALVLSVGDVLNLGVKDLFTTNGYNQVMVNGDGGDTVQLLGLLGNEVGEWNLSGALEIDGVTYYSYVNQWANAEVLVQKDVVVDLPMETPSVMSRLLMNDISDSNFASDTSNKHSLSMVLYDVLEADSEHLFAENEVSTAEEQNRDAISPVDLSEFSAGYLGEHQLNPPTNPSDVVGDARAEYIRMDVNSVISPGADIDKII